MLLAIDTSAGTSVAVVDERAVLAQHDTSDTRSHAEVIGILIQRALADAGAAPGDLDGVAVGMGPGPFTGLRVGIAAARAFAFAIDRPVLPVVSHDAVALGRAGDFAVVADARRRQVYWSRYAAPDALGLPVRIRGPELSAPDEVPSDAATIEVRTVPAHALGLLALRFQAAGRPLAADAPLYLRAPDVTLTAANASFGPVTPAGVRGAR